MFDKIKSFLRVILVMCKIRYVFETVNKYFTISDFCMCILLLCVVLDTFYRSLKLYLLLKLFLKRTLVTPHGKRKLL